MANLNVRINHKFDNYQNWMNSDLILGKGELAVAEIPSAQTDSGLTPPAIGIKVGDGVNKFSGLSWLQATAGDVYSWAKAAKKPEYTAAEISGLEDFIAGEIQDTNTTYTFEFANDTLIVKSKEKGSDELTTVAELKVDVSTKIDKVANATAGDVATMTEDGQVADSGVKLADLAKSADVASTYATKQELADEIGAVEQAATTLAERVGVNEGDIDALQQKDTELQTAIDNKVQKVTGAVDNVVLFAADGAIKDGGVAISALETKANAAATYETKENVASEIERVEGVVSGINERLGTAEGEIDDLQAAIETLNGTGTGSVQATVDAAINKFATDVTDDNVVNSYKELIDYVAEHGSEAAEMVADIKANQEAIATLEGKAHEHANKEVLDGISAEQVTAWDAAVQTVSGVETTKTGTNVEVTGVSADLLKNGAATLVLDCGTASTVL